MKHTYRFLLYVFSFLFLACTGLDTIKEKEFPEEQTSQKVRLAIGASSQIASIDLYVFDGVLKFHQQYTSTELNAPLNVRVPVGNYSIVAVANQTAEFKSPVIGSTTMSNLLVELDESTSSPGLFKPAKEWYIGSVSNVEIGCDASITIPIKRMVHKVIIEYIHYDSHLEGVSYQLDNLTSTATFEQDYQDTTVNNEIITEFYPAVQHVNVDSFYIFPSRNAVGVIHPAPMLQLTTQRELQGGTVETDYNYQLDAAFHANFITCLRVHYGEMGNVQFTQMPWDNSDELLLLDESPSAIIDMVLEEFDPVFNDTVLMQSMHVVLDVDQGYLPNYLNDFQFKIEKLTGSNAGTSIVKTGIELVEQGGKLVTKDPIYLSTGDYRISAYKIKDVEGVLPDPGGFSTPVTFTQGLAPITVDLQLQGRQGVENEFMRIIVEGLHGTGQTDGDLFPGASLYASVDALGNQLPLSNDGIRDGDWNASANNLVRKIPVRNEWRVYSVLYRAQPTKLNGVLPSEFNELLQLTEIDLRSNDLSGGIPYLGDLPFLNTIQFFENDLSGTLANLADLTTLEHVSIGDNNFTGTLEVGLFNSRNALVYLSVSNNAFTGTLDFIPLTIGSIFVQNNQLSGRVHAFERIVTGTTSQCDFRRNNFTCYDRAIHPYYAGGRVNPQLSGNIPRCP